jgi:hypothetical protein
MTSKSEYSRRRLSARLALARREIARFAAVRRHVDEERNGVRQPSKFSLLISIALAAIGVVAAVSLIQLIEAVWANP